MGSETVCEGLGSACEGSGSAWGCQSVSRETPMNASGYGSPGGLRVGMESSSGKTASGIRPEGCAFWGSGSEASGGSGESPTWPA